MKILSITCPCRKSSFTVITHDRDMIRARELEEDNWRPVGGVWYCWECVGLPMPSALRQAIADAEAIARGEDPYSDDDATPTEGIP